MKQRTRISDEQFRELLIKELAKPDNKANLKTNFFELLSTKYSIHKGRALELHDRYYSEFAKSKNEGLAKVSITKEQEALELALNDKNGHAKNLLENIVKLEKQATELEGVKIGAVRIGSEMVVTTQMDVNGAKRALTAIYAEIRATKKLLGDWYGLNAPTKQDITTQGEKINAVSDEKIESLIKKLR